MVNHTLAQLAELTQSELIGDPDYVISGINDLEAASPNEAAFLDNSRYEKHLASSKAGVIILTDPSKAEGRNLLVNESPSWAFQGLIELFVEAPKSAFVDIHPSAVIHESVQMGEGVSIGPNAVIDQGVAIGSGTHIGPGVSIGAKATVGTDCLFYPNVVVREGCQIGNRVILQPGAVIGSCGYGYFSDKMGIHHKLAHLGIVVLEDDVEVGANTAIDRARYKTTTIRRGTKIDNLVQIGHQVELGEHNLIVSQVGIAGSTKTGRHVVMGGQVGVTGHITITDGVTLAARSAVSKGITRSGTYLGIPAEPIREFNTHFVQLRSIGKLITRLKKLEKQVNSGD